MNNRAPLADERILVLASAAEFNSIQPPLAAAGLSCEPCVSLEHLCLALRQGAGALLLSDDGLGGEQLGAGSIDGLMEAIERQPNWSDIPILMFAFRGTSQVASAAMELLGNVTILERPVPLTSLVSALRTALRARRRQYALRDADRHKDEFLATLAHELRNPLASIANALHVLQRSEAAADVRSRAVDIVGRQSRHMARLVDDLLDLSRIARGNFELRKERVELEPVVRSAVETNLPLIQNAKHELRVEMPVDPVLLEADPVRLAQVLSNLLSNAAKYTPPGGTIVLKAHKDAAQLWISVRDTGAGIDPELLPHIFDLFDRTHSLGRRQGGLGLGLSLSRRLIALHGGSIEASSAGPGQGSEFRVRLPTRDDAVTHYQ